MTSSWRKRDYWDPRSNFDDGSSEDDDDFLLMVATAAAAAGAAAFAILTTTSSNSSRRPSPSPSYDRDRLKWKVPKIIECRPHVNDKVEAADLSEKESDMEKKIDPLATTTSVVSSLSSNARAANHRANERRSIDTLAEAIRTLNSSIIHAKRVRREIRRKNREDRRREEEYRHENERYDEWEKLQKRQEELYVELRNPELDEDQKRNLEADCDVLEQRKTALAVELRRTTDKPTNKSDVK